MLKHPLKTKQTGPEGTKIQTLIVQADAEPAKEFYLGMVLDRAKGVPVLMASAEGGMDIEEVAATAPGEDHQGAGVARRPGLQPFQARRLAYELGFTGDQAAKAEKIMIALSKVYLEKDATLAEINPLGDHQEGRRGRPRRQDRLRRQRPLPPQGHRGAARPERGEPGRGAGRRRRT